MRTYEDRTTAIEFTLTPATAETLASNIASDEDRALREPVRLRVVIPRAHATTYHQAKVEVFVNGTNAVGESVWTPLVSERIAIAGLWVGHDLAVVFALHGLVRALGCGSAIIREQPNGSVIISLGGL